MIKRFWFLLLVLLVEGAALMAVELMGAKLLAPFYGSSLYVWTAILSLTVLGLSLGYYVGGRWLAPRATSGILAALLALMAVLVALLPDTAGLVIDLTGGMGLLAGIVTATLLLMVPPMFCFGLVGPAVVSIMGRAHGGSSRVAGTVYFISTMGGIAATFLFGFFYIPDMGLRWCAGVCAIALGALPLLYVAARGAKLLPAEGFLLPVDGVQKNDGNSGTFPGLRPGKTRSGTTGLPILWLAALEGASVMAVELLAARMLAPYYGAGLYVWATVIGMTLLSLALGYFAGGRVAGRYFTANTLYWVLLGAGAFVCTLPMVAAQLTLSLAAVPLQTGVVMVSSFLLLPPLLLLGMVPTLLIRYLTGPDGNPGAMAGRVFTLSSASGILVLPVLGFWVIPAFGLSGPAVVVGLLVGAVPLWQLLKQKHFAALAFVVVLGVAVNQRQKAESSDGVDVLQYSEGLLGQILVADVLKNEKGEPTHDRLLFVNRMGQTVVDNTTNTSKWNYITFASSVASKLPVNSKALLLGLGGGSVANALSNGLGFSVDAIELDGRIADLAVDYFALSPAVNVVVDDARHYLETTTKTYDLIFFDVFKGDVPPPHVLSLECFERAKTLLSPKGMMIINFNGFLSGDLGRAGRGVFTTLQAAGFSTRILPTPGAEADRNCLFVASQKPETFYQLRSPLLYRQQPINMDSLFLQGGNIPFTHTGHPPDTVVFTDNQPRLDRLSLATGNTWRKGYNNTYTRFFLNNGVPLFE